MQYYKYKQRYNMKNKIFLTVIILIGFISTILPQQTFRRTVYLSQSSGTHIYDHSLVGSSGTTTVPNEIAIYNSTHGYTGDNAFTIIRITPDYPLAGDMIWQWNQVFFGGTEFYNTQNVIAAYAVPSTYDIINVTFGFNSAAMLDMALDTVTYPVGHLTGNYKYFIRNMVAAMEQYPDKYWILWDIPAEVESAGSSAADVLTQAQFNTWMIDTLQAGLDATYGAFPTNVYIFDIFSLLKNTGNNWMNDNYADGTGDSHPNALASSLVAPILVQQMFDAARAYEENLLPVELTSFSATTIGSTVKLSWNTATEINNFGFDVERASTSPTPEWTKIGFVEGHGTSNSPKYYSFEDNNLIARKYIYRLKQIDSDGQFEYSKEIEVDLNATIKYELSQNYPNPFNPTTTIHFSLPTSGSVKLTLYNTNGQEVRSLVNEYKESGTHIINFNASGLSSGVYFYKLAAGTFSTIRKMILVK